MKIVEHKVTAVDSIQSLASMYYGDASRWRDIVDFNNLDYPYISSDPNFQAITYSSGVVSAMRVYSASALTIPQGTIFAVPKADGYPSRQYASIIDVVVPAGVSVAFIPVQCTIPGLWGDVTQGAISTIVTTDPTLQNAFSLIGNVDPISNGDVLNVRLIGDSLLIPVDDSWNGVETYDDLQNFYEAQFGTDLALGADGDLFFDGYGAVGTVSGVDNLAQACRDILSTPKLSLVYHPEYGNLLDQMIPSAGAPYAMKLAGLYMTEALLMDDRVDRVNVVSVTQSGTQLDAVLDIYPIQGGDSVRVAVSAPLPIGS